MRAATTATTALLLSLALAAPSGAADVDSSASRDSKIGREKSLSIKNTRDDRDSQSTRRSKTKGKGGENTKSTSERSSGNIGGSAGLDLTIPARDLFGSDGLNYRLAADFGLSGTRKYEIDVTFADYLSQIAKANSPVSSLINPEPVKKYLREIAEAGAVLGQAMMYLDGDIRKVGSMKKTADGAVEVTGLGADDLLPIAAAALKRAQAGITDKRIKTRLEEILSYDNCRFVGDVTQVECGSALLTLSSPPSLKHRGVEWYGQAFAGAAATYKVSSSWSWQKALEAARSDSEHSRWASEVSAAAEKLESEGRAVEAALTRKRSFDKGRSAKTSVGTGKFLPGIQQ